MTDATPAPTPDSAPTTDPRAAGARLGAPLTLPSGAVLKNRIAKSAMSEALAGKDLAPTVAHERVYGRWARGGAGLLITGNVMVDAHALGEPGNVAVEDGRHAAALHRWAEAGTQGGAHLWMQLNHPGRQAPKSVMRTPAAPSAVPLGGSAGRFFGTPRALETQEVRGIVERFAATAAHARAAGFTGVQIHGAHGYLVNQFLSPEANRRTDRYGGDLEGRMRFLVEIYAALREELGDGFPIGLKLNSSDFSEGGLTEEDSRRVAQRMGELGLDLLEVSGGSYTSPAMMGGNNDGGTYFERYARRLRDVTDVPVMLTGGFRSAATMAAALADGVTDVVGLARPFVIEPELASRAIAGQEIEVELPRVRTGLAAGDSTLGPALALPWYELQLARLGKGLEAQDRMSAVAPLVHMVRQHGPAALSPRRG